MISTLPHTRQGVDDPTATKASQIATSSFSLKGVSMDDNRIRTAVAAWLADATVAEAVRNVAPYLL